jgi:hypothetical protein
MSDRTPQPSQDDFLNVFMTAFFGVGVVMTVQAQEDLVNREDSDADAL